jgi:hypothetical protein
MAGNLTIESCGDVFFPTTHNASSNYGIGSDGRVGMYVEEKNRAWTSSSAANDHQAVTIEVANSATGGNWPVSDMALATLIELCTDICRRNNIPKLVFTGDAAGNFTQHNYFSATVCPGPYLKERFPYIADEVNKKLCAAPPAPPSPTVPTGSQVIRVLTAWTGNTVKTMDVEEYLRGVVPSEVYPSWNIEALKAQAVAARSIAYKKIESNHGKPYDVDDAIAYNPDKINPRTDMAVAATHGMILTYKGMTAETAYSASNGGQTVSAKEQWGSDVPYLPAQSDPFDKNKANGHGVGMSQWGAKGRADAGQGFEAILAFYYPGTELAFVGSALPSPEKTPVEITVDNALADGVIVDREYWLNVLSGNNPANHEYIKAVFDRYHAKLK